MKKIIPLILVSLFIFCTACDYADKKSNTLKDSVGGDAPAKNIVGGSETYETKLDEVAGDYLKNIVNRLLLEQQANKLALTKSKDPSVKEFAKAMQVANTNLMLEFEAYAQEKRVLLPSSAPAYQTLTIPKNSKDAAISFDEQYLMYLKSNCDTTLSIVNEAMNNREQDFKRLMKKEHSIIKGKSELIQENLNSFKKR